MISITQDPNNPDRVVVSQYVVTFLDKILLENLKDELATIIRRQAQRDLKKNKAVQQAVSEAASKKLLNMLGVGNDTENNSGTVGVSSAK